MHLVFAAHAEKEASAAASERLMQTAERAGFDCSILDRDRRLFDDGETVIVAVGGDGNFIRTAQIACEADLPVFGVNFGHVGFLTERTEADFSEALACLKNGAYRIESRSMLSVSVNGKPAHDCLNDLLVYKKSFSGVARIAFAIDGNPAGDFSGDGIVVATSTGATGYSLSAGGPIVSDGLDAMVITPICAHTLHFRPIVAPLDAVITMCMADGGVLAADGDRFCSVQSGDRITVQKSARTVRFLTFGTRNLFRLISEKLN